MRSGTTCPDLILGTGCSGNGHRLQSSWFRPSVQPATRPLRARVVSLESGGPGCRGWSFSVPRRRSQRRTRDPHNGAQPVSLEPSSQRVLILIDLLTVELTSGDFRTRAPAPPRPLLWFTGSLVPSAPPVCAHSASPPRDFCSARPGALSTSTSPRSRSDQPARRESQARAFGRYPFLAAVAHRCTPFPGMSARCVRIVESASRQERGRARRSDQRLAGVYRVGDQPVTAGCGTVIALPVIWSTTGGRAPLGVRHCGHGSSLVGSTTLEGPDPASLVTSRLPRSSPSVPAGSFPSPSPGSGHYGCHQVPVGLMLRADASR